MKALAALFFLLAFSMNAMSGEQVDNRLAIEYLKITRVEKIVDATIDAYDQQLFTSLSPAERAQALALIRETMGWEKIKESLAELVSRTYTKSELKAAIAFMKTPLGASYNLKSEVFSTQFANLLSSNIQKFLREHPIQANSVGSSGTKE
jgi:hypothetical protein